MNIQLPRFERHLDRLYPDFARRMHTLIQGVEQAFARIRLGDASALLTASTNTLLGRSSADTGPVEEITCTAVGRALLDDATASAQRITLGVGVVLTNADTTAPEVLFDANGDILMGIVS